jgi:hypothetical protein
VTVWHSRKDTLRFGSSGARRRLLAPIAAWFVGGPFVKLLWGSPRGQAALASRVSIKPIQLMT